MPLCIYLTFTNTGEMCTLVALRTYICRYWLIVCLNSFNAFANIDISTKTNLTKEWLIYFKIPSRIFENVRIQELRKIETDK